MSVREEDPQKKSSTSGGLGLAAAALGVGVGVGAALYYFFSKRPENPDSVGSTSQWRIERPDTFNMDTSGNYISSDSEDCVTISEHTTTDTSMYSHDGSSESSDSDVEMYSDQSDIQTLSDSVQSESDNETVSSESSVTSDSNSTSDEMEETGYWTFPVHEIVNDSDSSEWEMMSSDSLFRRLSYAGPAQYFRRRSTQESIRNVRKNEAFRERTWSLEQCTICYEVILKGQEVMSLPCTHNFHSTCIMPWLQEQQTCPNCRTSVN